MENVREYQALPPRELEEVEREARAAAEALLASAREAVANAAEDLRRIEGSVLFGNGFASACREAIAKLDALDEAHLEKLLPRLYRHFEARGEGAE